MFDRSDDVLELVRRELQRPVATDPARKAHLMELVHASAARSHQPRWRGGRGPRTGWTSPISQLALAAGIAGIMAVGAIRSLGPARGPLQSAAGGLIAGDTVASTLRDTLRLVRFIFVSPTAARVALAGDFNDWSARATPLVPAESAGVWSVAVALAPGRHRYAFVVNDTQWVTDPATPRVANAHAGRPASVVTVSTDSN